MKIKDFIQGRNVSYSSVFQYIKRNPKLFKGHIGNKNNIELDDVAVEFLEEKYPIPKPVQVIEDNEAKRQLIEAQQLIIKLQQQLVEAAPKIAWAEQNKVLFDIAIEDKERLLSEISKLKEEKEAAKAEALEKELLQAENELKAERNDKVVSFLKAELENNWEEEENLRDRIKQLEDENEALKNRNLISRLRNDMPEIEITKNIYIYKMKAIKSQQRDKCIEQILNGEKE